MIWQFIKWQQCAEIPCYSRACYLVEPGHRYVGVRVCWN